MIPVVAASPPRRKENVMTAWWIATLLALGAGQSVPLQTILKKEPTDIMIRRLAGLPPNTARGAIEILDVGHDPMDTMLSIVATRLGDGWSVSYACAESLRCAEGADHAAATYRLAPDTAAEVDHLLDTLRTGTEPDGQLPSANVLGGWLKVVVNDRGFHRTYHRVGSWGTTLGRLETLLRPPSA